MKGFSLISLMITIAVAGILWMIGQPTFNNQAIDCKNPDARFGYTNRAKLANITGALGIVHLKLERHYLQHGTYPETMELGLDLWDHPYMYHVYTTTGDARKDHQNHEVNTGGYPDVYSLGPDGRTATPFTSVAGGDDIVIANNGAYIGVACFHYRRMS